MVLRAMQRLNGVHDLRGHLSAAAEMLDPAMILDFNTAFRAHFCVD
jgi:hypothetical protein